MKYATIAGSRASINTRPQIITSRWSGRRQTIFRAAGDGKPSTTLSNVALSDTRLSCEALGALARIMKLPDDWTFNVAWLCRTFGMGKDRAWRILRELETNGYMKRAQQRDANGRLGRAEYLFTDDPATWHDLAELPHPEKPCTVNPPPTKNRDLQDRSAPDAPEVSEEAITEAAAMAPHV
ncbi:MAG TPA: hypothetical protein VF226_20305, partial [Hyphomicrobiaceae bacterium]